MIADLKSQKFTLPVAQSVARAASASIAKDAVGERETLSIFIAHPSHFLTDHKPSGDGLVAYDLILQLARRGHRLHIAVGEVDLRDELPENVKLYPIKTHYAPLTMLWRLEYAVKVKRLFDRLHREIEIDLIHQLNPVVTGLSLFLGRTGCPLVLGPYVPYWSKSFEFPDYQPSFAESVINAGRDFVLTKLLHRQQRLAQALLVSTPAALGKMSDAPDIRAKTHELPYSVDVKKFSPKGLERDYSQPPNILFLANLRYQKGIYTLLDAFETISRIHPTCRLTIGGTGEEEVEIRRRIARMKSAPRISMTGNVERERIPEMMRGSTVYCLPSYGEPFGMSALEAMACGVPVVATDVGGLSYLVTDEGGRKVPPKDAPALAAALLEIINSPRLQAEMGRFNRAQALQHYTAPKIVERLENIYRQTRSEVKKEGKRSVK